MAQATDSVDDGNCQPDMQTGMLTGEAKLPPKLEATFQRMFAQQARANALRRKTDSPTEEPNE